MTRSASCSAVNSNVVVTVLDAAGVPQVDAEVFAKKNNGVVQASGFTNASGQVTLSLPANSYRFAVEEAGEDFFSGAVGHCVTPSCTTASITITRVDVTVVDTSGAPQVGQMIWWEKTGGGSGGYVDTNASGHALIAVPAGSYRFVATMNGWDFTSGAAGHCTIPGCTAATITTTLPVAVTVRDTNNVPQPNLTVGWEDALGGSGGWIDTDANGVAVLSVPPGSYMFMVYLGNNEFLSGAPNHCVVPGCTSASITVSAPVLVTVVDTGGTPLSGKTVVWEQIVDAVVEVGRRYEHQRQRPGVDHPTARADALSHDHRRHEVLQQRHVQLHAAGLRDRDHPGQPAVGRDGGGRQPARRCRARR